MINYDNEESRRLDKKSLISFGLTEKQADIYLDTDKTIIQHLINTAGEDLDNEHYLYIEYPSLAQLSHAVTNNILDTLRNTRGHIDLENLLHRNAVLCIYTAYLKGREDEKLSIWENSND